jgi:hypothetical protein
MYVAVKELPNSLIRALASIGYGKKDIDVNIQDTVSLQVSGGDGRRGFALIVNLATGETHMLQGSWGGSNMFNPDNRVDLDQRDHKLGENVAVSLGSIVSWLKECCSGT